MPFECFCSYKVHVRHQMLTRREISFIESPKSVI